MSEQDGPTDADTLGNGDAQERSMTREEFVESCVSQGPVARVVTLMHLECGLDAKAATLQRGDTLEPEDVAAAVQIKSALIGIETSMPPLWAEAVGAIRQQVGITPTSPLTIVGNLPTPDIMATHASNPERTFTECGVPLSHAGLKIGHGLAQVTCKLCHEVLKDKR